MCLILLAGVTLTACDDGEELSTDQYGNEIKLNSFGPCPVLRGGVLKFLGSNLDQITEVDLPGADPITAIDIKAAGTHSEIWINVPKEKCEPGIVVLKTAKGGEIRTLTPVTYEENIVLSSVYVGQEGNLNGNVGDIVTFKGDYLNLMHEVIFADDVRVPETEFIAHDRYTIAVAIPKEAKTGKPMLSDSNPEGENLLYADNAITIGLPTANVAVEAPVKAGDIVTVKGTSLNLIESVELNGAEVPAEGITVTDGNKTILFYLPATATDGEVTLVTFSGVKIPAGNIETVVPTQLVAAPAPVKNGAELTISGKDLDLVTGIAFPNADGEIKASDAGKLVAVVPETAQEGDITLSLANGKQVTVAYTLVKPTVTECSPSALMAGSKVMIKGTDLDLVQSITLPGDPAQTVTEFAAQNEKAIALVIPTACAGSGLTLNLKNGTSIEASVKITERSNNELTFIVPEMTTGEVQIVFVTPDGTRIEAGKTVVDVPEIDFATFAKDEQQTGYVTWPFNFSWGDSMGKMRVFRKDLQAMNLQAGKSKIIVYKTAGITGQIQVNNANWGGITTIADWDGSAERIEWVVDDAFIDAINNIQDGWSDTALILQGDLQGVKKMTILP